MIVEVTTLTITNDGVFIVSKRLVAAQSRGLHGLLNKHIAIRTVNNVVLASDKFGKLVSIGAVVGNSFDISNCKVDIFAGFLGGFGDLTDTSWEIAR